MLVHADESCLGNQNQGPNPGGAGALVEVRQGGGVARKDLFISSPDTTNNRMALLGACEVLDRLANKGNRLNVVYVSDSKYLVQGMKEWRHGWKARGWKRKAGPIENLEMWQRLDELEGKHDVRWSWVRGHAGHAKNEYADYLAVSAAEGQTDSNGFIDSGFDSWLENERARNKYIDYDPAGDFETDERLS